MRGLLFGMGLAAAFGTEVSAYTNYEINREVEQAVEMNRDFALSIRRERTDRSEERQREQELIRLLLDEIGRGPY